jgi:hypothetical protein
MFDKDNKNVSVLDSLPIEAGVEVVVGVGLESRTPLFQTNFLPDLMQVYFLPANVEVDPAFVQLPPALGVAA